MTTQTSYPLRAPVIAGTFYPADPQALAATADNCLSDVPVVERMPVAARHPG